MRAIGAAVIAGLAAAGVGRVPGRTATGHYASPGGSARGDGSRARPWDLGTALAGGHGSVEPGDTVWLLGGTYRGPFVATLQGTSSAPVVVRQSPGNRATIDGTLRVDGAHAVYWGFEIMQSDPVANGADALDTYGPNCRFVNLVVHDAGKQGISFWENAGTSELYGSLFYNNGTHERLDHGIYAAGEGGEKWITDNIVFDNLAYGIHVYAGSRHPYLSDINVRGNVAFNTGTISPRGSQDANLLIGGDVLTQHMTADSNLLYFSGTEGWNLRLGMPRGDNRDILVRGNYVAGGAITFVIQGWANAAVTGNHFIGAADLVDLRTAGSLAQNSWRDNAYQRDPAARAWRFQQIAYDLAAWETATGLGRTGTATPGSPPGPAVFVRPNKYERGRATIVVYNWGRQPVISVDVSSVVRPGASYEIHNVQDFFGQPIMRGVYAGSSLAIPMSGVEAPRPIGRSTPTPPRTAPDFDVFILTSAP